MQVEALTRITIQEFEQALLRVCTIPAATPKLAPPMIGLAVSGGLDSMCLAGLAGRLQEQNPERFRFRALIVDHKARPRSVEEAQKVKTWVEEQGLPASVLELQWPEDLKPMRQKNFETLARSARFKALGFECRRHRITELLLGHHEDDQAETVLGRIAAGYTGSGLNAISPSGSIPECFGMIGVHNLPYNWYQRQWMNFATPGVTIHRPLLEFSKARLRSTCHHLELKWVEDKTNSDPTLTQRNAVRYLLTQNVPLALTKVSLLSLQRSMSQKLAAIHQAAGRVLREIRFSVLDIRSGVLRIVIPVPHIINSPTRQDLEDDSDLAEAMVQVAHCVTPAETVTRTQGAEIAARVFQDPPVEPSFTLAHISWQAEEITVPGSIVWTLSREPHKTWCEPPLCIWTRDGPYVATGESRTQTSRFGTWQLFDGRFWLRLWSELYPSLVVRPLTDKDMEGLHKRLTKKRFEKLKIRLRAAAPGPRIPKTLPVIATSLHGPILAFPTLGLPVLGEEIHDVNWEVQYKRVALYNNPGSSEQIGGRVAKHNHEKLRKFYNRLITSKKQARTTVE